MAAEENGEARTTTQGQNIGRDLSTALQQGDDISDWAAAAGEGRCQGGEKKKLLHHFLYFTS